MDLINLKDVSDLNVNFNVKVIDIDFYNVSNRRVSLGHVGDYNLYVLHLIIPKDNDWVDPMQVILSYQNNTLSKAKWITNPSKIVGNSYYFLVKGDIVSTAGAGFLQFQVVLPSNDATTKTVIAKSKKIPYIVEESLTLEGSAEEVTPEQMSLIDSLIADCTNLINDYTNLIDAYEVTDLKMLNKRVSDLEALNGYENLYNPFLNTYSVVRLDLANNTTYTVNYNPSNPTTSILPDGTIQTAAHISGNYRELFYNPDFKTKKGEKYRISGKVIIHKNKRDSIAIDKRKMDCFFINSVENFPTNDTNKIKTTFFTEELGGSDVTTASPLESAWFSADFTAQEDGTALIFGAFPESSTVTTNTTANDSPVKITNFILTKVESETKEDSIFSRYSKNDLEKAYKEVVPVSIYREDKVLDYLKRAREKKEYYLIDIDSYDTSIIDDTTFISSTDTTNYSIPNPYILSVPSNSSTVEFFNTQTKENWIYSIEQGQTEFKVKNLIPEHLYVYTFKESNGDITDSDFLKIKGPIRFIDIGVNGNEEEIVNNKELKPESTVFNVRDLGGWKCDRGKLKYGVIYRGSTLSEKYEGTIISLSDSQKEFLVDKLKIRDEISLRWASEISGRTSSVLNGVNGQQVGYRNFDIGYYNPLTNSRPEIIANIIKRLSDNIRNNKTTYLHCSAGADRTALICSIIEAMCGVSQIDLDCDYEISSLAIDRSKISETRYGRRLTRDRDPYGSSSRWDRGYLFQELRNKGNGNLRDGTINFLLENGVTREEIDIIRAGLIEYEEPKELLVDSAIENDINQATHNKLYVPTTEAVINYISDIDSEKITRSELFTDFEDSQLIDFTPCDISLNPVTAQLQARENKIKMFATGGSQGLIQKQTLDLEEDIILSAGELYQFTLSRAGGSNDITIDLVDEEQNVYKTYTLRSNALISDKIRIGSSNITIHQFYCVPVPAYGLPSGEYTLTLTHITTIKEELLGLERFVERGEVDSQLISDPGGPHKMTGNYMLKDGFCYLTVKAQLIAGWADSSYPLPVSAIRNATTVASNGTRLYEISLGLTNNGAEATYLTISPLERKFAPNPATGVYASGDPIYFTFCYQYQ